MAHTQIMKTIDSTLKAKAHWRQGVLDSMKKGDSPIEACEILMDYIEKLEREHTSGTYERTTLALNQIIHNLSEALEEGVTFDQYVQDLSSGQEFASSAAVYDAISKFEDLLEEAQYMLGQLRETPAHS